MSSPKCFKATTFSTSVALVSKGESVAPTIVEMGTDGSLHMHCSSDFSLAATACFPRYHSVKLNEPDSTSAVVGFATVTRVTVGGFWNSMTVSTDVTAASTMTKNSVWTKAFFAEPWFLLKSFSLKISAAGILRGPPPARRQPPGPAAGGFRGPGGAAGSGGRGGGRGGGRHTHFVQSVPSTFTGTLT